jgi:hypothetical protein
MADKHDLMGVDARVGLEVVDDAAGTPGPYAYGAPVVQGARGARALRKNLDGALSGPRRVGLQVRVTIDRVPIPAAYYPRYGSEVAGNFWGA